METFLQAMDNLSYNDTWQGRYDSICTNHLERQKILSKITIFKNGIDAIISL